MTEDRRSSDTQIADLRVIVASHISACVELNKIANQRHVESLGRMDAMNGKLDELLDDRKIAKAMRRFATAGWGALVLLAGGASWLWEHVR